MSAPRAVGAALRRTAAALGDGEAAARALAGALPRWVPDAAAQRTLGTNNSNLKKKANGSTKHVSR